MLHLYLNYIISGKTMKEKTKGKTITGLMQLQMKMGQTHNHVHCKICSGILPYNKKTICVNKTYNSNEKDFKIIVLNNLNYIIFISLIFIS